MIRLRTVIAQHRARALLFHLDLYRVVGEQSPSPTPPSLAAVSHSLHEQLDTCSTPEDPASFDEYYARLTEGLARDRHLGPYANPLGAVARQSCCARCPYREGPCRGAESDSLHLGPDPECLNDVHAAALAARDVARRLYSGLVPDELLEAVVHCRVEESSASIHAPVVRAFGFDGYTGDRADVVLSVEPRYLSAASWHALPSIVFHELLVHVFQYTGSASGWRATGPEDPFAEGMMDSLAHRELVSSSRLDERIWSDDDRVGVIEVAGHIAACRTSHHVDTPADRADPHTSFRIIGDRAYTALSRYSHRSQEEVHRFLAALNVRAFDGAARYRIASCLSKAPRFGTEALSLRQALLDFDIDEVERLCRSAMSSSVN